MSLSALVRCKSPSASCRIITASKDEKVFMTVNGAAAAIWIELKVFRSVVDEVGKSTKTANVASGCSHWETRAYETCGMLAEGCADLEVISHVVEKTAVVINTPSAAEPKFGSLYN